MARCRQVQQGVQHAREQTLNAVRAVPCRLPSAGHCRPARPRNRGWTGCVVLDANAFARGFNLTGLASGKGSALLDLT